METTLTKEPKLKINSKKTVKQDKTNELVSVIREIIYLPENAQAKGYFEVLTNQYKYKSCDTGFGWSAGEGIEFICKFEKNGEGETIQTLVEGLKDVDESLTFIYGLNPKIFHFNPLFKFDDQNQLYLTFKLLKDAR